jgi:hypothetical protein
MCLQPQARAEAVGSMPAVCHHATSSSTSLQLAMVATTRELVADFATECLPLDKAPMMGVLPFPPARLRSEGMRSQIGQGHGHKSDALTSARSTRLGIG